MKETGLAAGVMVAMIIVAIVVAGVGGYFLLSTPPSGESGGGTGTGEGETGENTPQTDENLQILFKDDAVFDIKKVQPTIRECWLQRENGTWTPIWSGEKVLTLTPGGTAQNLASVNLDAGTFVAHRVFIHQIYVEMDLDGDNVVSDGSVNVGSEESPYYENEKRTEIRDEYFYPTFPETFVYDGGGGTLVYDITFNPDLAKPENQWVTVTVETQTT